MLMEEKISKKTGSSKRCHFLLLFNKSYFNNINNVDFEIYHPIK